MEVWLNLMGFIDILYKEMMTSLIAVSSRNTFPFNLLLQASVDFFIEAI